jgi:endonuclease/exonuclease/phosphatase family metal-dependent hydrolase
MMIKNIFTTLLILFGLVSAQAKELTIVSYNIRHGANMQGELKLEDTAKVLKSLKADVIALQEVDQKTTRTAKVAQAEYLGKQLGMHHVFGKAMDYKGGGYGQAILSKYPILESKVHQLPAGGEPRIALEVVVEHEKGKKLSFVSIHLDHLSEKIRQAQIKALIEELKEVRHPVVLLGDFNAKPESDSMKLFNDEWFNVPKKGNALTYPANVPTIEIDYFMLRGWKTDGLTCKVIEEKNVSDHRPLMMKIE